MAEAVMPVAPVTMEEEEDLSIYPSSNGEPMGETQWHVEQLAMLIETLKAYFDRAKNVLVMGNVLLFYEQGNPKRFVVPDLFVVRGVSKEPLRESYFAWREGKYPDFILELLSEKTAACDRTEKWRLYEKTFRAAEYFLCDPWEETLEGYRLRRGAYHRLPADAHGRVASKELGLSFGWEDDWLRVYKPDGTPLPTQSELIDENARLLEELERLRTQLKKRRK